MLWAHHSATRHLSTHTTVLKKWNQHCLKVIVRMVGEGHPQQDKTVGALSHHHTLVFNTRLASSICVAIIRAVL
jgi:hypothetical protein